MAESGETGVEHAGNNHCSLDLFLFAVRSDAAWADWISWQLEEAGFQVGPGTWPNPPGSNWIRALHQGVQNASRTIVVVSASSLLDALAEAVWQTVLAKDPAGENGTLLLVRVDDHPLPGILARFVPLDLFDACRDDAIERLLAAIEGTNAKPRAEPHFPGQMPARLRGVEPSFPGRFTARRGLPGRNRHFTGRDELLARLHTSLMANNLVAVTAMHGMGGVGKSQLAIEYAYRNLDDYSLVLWVDAEQTGLIAEKIAALADVVGLPKTGRAADTAAAVLAELGRRDRWLVILDNAESPAKLSPWIPCGPGHVLITSRNPNWEALASTVSVEIFTRAESTSLLARRVPGSDQHTLENLAAELADLPLGLAQAASYMSTNGTAADNYLVKFRAQRDIMLRSGDDPLYARTVATAWSVSLEQLQADSPESVRLLRLCALMSPEPIPTDILPGRQEPLPRPRSDAHTSTHRSPDRRLDLDEVIGAARRYSLLRRDEDTIQVHRLVQAVIADSSREAQGWASLCRAAIEIAAGAVEKLDVDLPVNWPRFHLISPHLQALCQSSAPFAGFEHAGRLAHAIAMTVGAHGMSGLPEAGEALARIALRLLDAYCDEKELMEISHEMTWQIAQRIPAEAEHMYRRNLEKRRGLYGDDDLRTIYTRNEIAWIAAVQGEWNKAEEQYREVLAARAALLGDEHPFTLITRHELAWTIGNQDRITEAEGMFRTVLAARRQILGNDHPRTLGTRHELAWISGLTGRWEEAETEYRYLLEARLHLLGALHPDTLACLHEIGWILANRGCWPAAVEAYQEELTARRQIHRDDHPNLIAARQHIELCQRQEIPLVPRHIV
ncbi:putative ATP /GTP-binding protein [Frankia canadensis]|uniref:Putative ATP /GTP-binding protein n=1 Tax=Frankia canadensis TaxID=1836972 RepID=A0A2I2KJC7_9ACTN|nr:FxSxx-COOH system tetratricopeptide repeat protein [Frankia canadensis]SNQ45760.1 putative ATP /GTP-binding protein [Frankia canadensis]SOU53050.1 putative ATP /GTP-binding protein [Frankia canadensis]